MKEILEHCELLLCESLASATRSGGIGVAKTNRVLRWSTREHRGKGVVIIMMIHGRTDGELGKTVTDLFM